MEYQHEQQSPAMVQHAVVEFLIRSILENGQQGSLFDRIASPEVIARACARLANELYSVDDPRNSAYLEDCGCEEFPLDPDVNLSEDMFLVGMVGIMFSVYRAAINLLLPGLEPDEDLKKLLFVNARRIASDPATRMPRLLS